MARSLSEYLRAAAEAAEADERADRDADAMERLKAMEERAQGETLSAEDRELLEWARKFRAELDKDDEPDEPPAAKPKDEAKPDEPEPEAKPKRVRPGRKSGGAYDFDVDESTGKVVKLDVARIYSGEDEPDEVEIAEREADAAS